MSLLRKTSELLHLEPGKDAWLKQSAFTPAHEGISPEELQPLIRRLLEEPSLETAEAHKVITELRAVTTRAGHFLTASEIQRCLSGFNFEDGDGGQLDGARAYEFAAKLHWEHLHRQIEAIESESRRMGPTVFATFLEEMVACLIRGDDAHRAVEIPVVLAEELLQRILEPSRHILDYMALAERAIGVSLDCFGGWIAKNAPKTGAAADEEDDQAEPEELEAESGPLAREVMAYLREIEAAFQRVGLELNELLAPIESSALVSECDEKTKAARLRDYHNVLRRIGSQAGHAPIHAMVLEGMSLVAQADKPEEAKALALEAADLYDAQAEKEERLELPLLQDRREKHAKSLRDTGASPRSDSGRR